MESKSNNSLVTKGVLSLESIEVARRAVEAASNKLAQDLILLDIKQVSSFAEYFVICSAESSRQIDAIVEEVRDQLKNEGVTPYRIEGDSESGWVLIDLGFVIVHIFSPEKREYYKLDELWGEGTPIIRIL
jgi:ribosome-associated protein